MHFASDNVEDVCVAYKWIRPQLIYTLKAKTALAFLYLYFLFGSTLTYWILTDSSGDSKRSCKKYRRDVGLEILISFDYQKSGLVITIFNKTLVFHSPAVKVFWGEGELPPVDR